MSWVTLVLLLVVGGAAYLGWIWLPVYFDHYTVKQVVADYMNQAVKNADDAQLRRDMVAKIHSLGTVEVVDAYGRTSRVPAIPVEEGAVVWERDAGAKSLRIAFEYERRIIYPVLDRVSFAVFTLDRTGDLNRADWGPQR